VALCAYNGARFLQEQLCSIENQSLKVDEIVICDDGSTDGTSHIVNSFSGEHPRLIRYYRNEKTLGYAQNFGRAISLCSGDIIFLSDQDDFWLPTKVEKTVAVLAQDDNCGVVAARAIVTDQNLNPTGMTLSLLKKDILGGPHSFSAHYQRSFAYGCTLALRSSLRPLILPISANWGHDNWICFIASMFSRIKATEEPLMLYRRHSASAGLNDGLDFSTSRQLFAAYKKSRVLDYETDFENWNAMYGHLQNILSTNLAGNTPIRMPLPKNAPLDAVKERLEFSKQRLKMAAKPRPLRVFTALRMLLTGQYHEFVSGWKSLAKDLLTV